MLIGIFNESPATKNFGRVYEIAMMSLVLMVETAEPRLPAALKASTEKRYEESWSLRTKVPLYDPLLTRTVDYHATV